MPTLRHPFIDFYKHSMLSTDAEFRSLRWNYVIARYGNIERNSDTCPPMNWSQIITWSNYFKALRGNTYPTIPNHMAHYLPDWVSSESRGGYRSDKIDPASVVFFSTRPRVVAGCRGRRRNRNWPGYFPVSCAAVIPGPRSQIFLPVVTRWVQSPDRLLRSSALRLFSSSILPAATNDYYVARRMAARCSGCQVYLGQWSS